MYHVATLSEEGLGKYVIKNGICISFIKIAMHFRGHLIFFKQFLSSQVLKSLLKILTLKSDAFEIIILCVFVLCSSWST